LADFFRVDFLCAVFDFFRVVFLWAVPDFFLTGVVRFFFVAVVAIRFF
jgi:hypothetical protein